MNTINEKKKRAWAEVSLPNLRHNYRSIRAYLPKDCRFLGVVKADAYGHGALSVSKLLEAEGADYLAVSCLDEALELRHGGISMPILILGHTPAEYTNVLIENNLSQTITCLSKAMEYSSYLLESGQTLTVHIKVDTGMSRLGFICSGSHREQGVDNIIQACCLPGINAEGIYTHFAVSDELDTESIDFTRYQYELFCGVIKDVETRLGKSFLLHHCANSGAVVNYPEMAMDMVRPGLLLYGYGDAQNKLGLKPCMQLFAKISTIKIHDPATSVSYGRRFISDDYIRIGVLSIGYADGLPRLISNKCEFVVGNRFVRQIGTVCMDMCMIDINGIPEIGVGEAVEIFGENNDINKLSQVAQTIPYELLCSISKRVHRVYID